MNEGIHLDLDTYCIYIYGKQVNAFIHSYGKQDESVQ